MSSTLNDVGMEDAEQVEGVSDGREVVRLCDDFDLTSNAVRLRATEVLKGDDRRGGREGKRRGKEGGRSVEGEGEREREIYTKR